MISHRSLLQKHKEIFKNFSQTNPQQYQGTFLPLSSISTFCAIFIHGHKTFVTLSEKKVFFVQIYSIQALY